MSAVDDARSRLRTWAKHAGQNCDSVDGCPVTRDVTTVLDAFPVPLSSSPARAFDPAGDPPLTVRQHPTDGRTDPDARRVIRTAAGPWLAISGPDAGRVLAEHEVADWPTPHPAWWSPSLRGDLDHLQSLARSESAR